ncbi:hypothetical protein RMCBS344292_14347 [Rhizopus microsporus]|nr:hypothetical protein RMCBS344292_14347 [Rhizopus microsporus]
MTDTLKCFLCKVELSQWKQGQSPFTRHAYESPDCPWVVLDFPDNPSHDLDVDQTTAKGTRMRSMRLATFTRHNYWPPKKKAQKALPSATKIANAGFYFAPTREHPTRVRCPYCHSEIMDPSEIEDIIEEHKKLNKECIFFKNTRSSRSRLSLATSEARSALSASKDNPSSEANPENDIWSIDTTFTSAPKLTRKSRLVTYSKRESRKRRDTGLSSSSKSISKKSKDVKRPKIIVHETSPSPSDATNDSNSDELIIQNVPSQQKKLSTFIPTHTTHVDTSMDEPSDNIVASRTTSPGRSKVRVLKQIDDNQEEPIISIKKDKGKGRQIEPTMASIRPLAKKNLSLSKNKTRTNDPYILINDPSSHQPVGSSSSTSSSHGSNDSSTGIKHPTRVRCPYCHSEIMDPSEIEDIIEEHKKLNKECIFFKNTRSSRSRLSLATSEARSALSASKDNPSSEANPENDIWSIDTTFTSAPKLTRKSRLVTYSKRESRKRRDTGLSSSSKSISKKSKDVKRPKIIVHETSPSPSDATNDSNSDELIIQNVPSQQKKLSTFIPTHTTHVDTSMDEPSDNIVASRTTSPGRSKVRVLKQIDDNQEEPIISIKKDKGKGRQIEPTMASIRPLAKKNLSLSKNKTRTNDPYILINDPSSHQPVGSSSSTSSSHGSNDSSTGISNSHPFHHVISTPPHSQTLFSRDTEPLDDLTNQQSGAYVFDVESLDDETTSIQQLNEPLQFMQSTPAQSSQMEVDAHDIFGSRPCSPIEPKNGTIEGSIGDTPVTSYREEGGRTRRLITFEEGEAKLIRHWSPSTSPSVPALNMHEEHVSDEIMAELDDEQKKMTVEQYTLSLIEQSIQIIKEKGYEKIEQIEKEAERRRREILSRQLL